MGQKEKEESNEGKNALEWVVFIFGILAVSAILIYLVYQAVTHKSSPPEIAVALKSDPSEKSPYRYHLTIKNEGGETAEEVKIEVVLQTNDTITEKAALQLAFVPTSSMREGWVNFTVNPLLADTVYARVVSYKRP